jgi:hypothetical protein
MSITETTQAPPRRKAKRKPARKVAAAPKPSAEMAGLTIDKCPTACNAEGCVISGRPVCGHPRKGGLQGADMHNSDAIGRSNAAKRLLGKRMLDARTG